MGARGPAPKPTALKQAQGNPGRRQLNDDEPVPPAGDVDCPPWVTGVARDVWNELEPVLRAMKTLTTADRLTFGRYCVAFARYLDLQSLVWKDAKATTYPVRSDDGKVRYIAELPQAAELRRLHEILLRLEQQFGLSPSARSRIRVQPTTGNGGHQPAPMTGSHHLKFFGGGGPAKSAG